MKVAVLVSGEMRTWSSNILHFIEMFKQAACGGDVHYFGALHDKDWKWAAGCNFWRAVTIFQPGVLDEVETLKKKLNYPKTCPNPVKAVSEQWQGMTMVWNLFCAHADYYAQNYDWIVRLRPDLKILEPMEPLDKLRRTLYIPKHNNWGGVNDRFAFGPASSMMHYMTYWEDGLEVLEAAEKPLNLERILGRVLKKHGVGFSRTKAVLMPNRGDSVDAPVYREDRNDVAA